MRFGSFFSGPSKKFYYRFPWPSDLPIINQETELYTKDAFLTSRELMFYRSIKFLMAYFSIAKHVHTDEIFFVFIWKVKKS